MELSWLISNSKKSLKPTSMTLDGLFHVVTIRLTFKPFSTRSGSCYKSSIHIIHSLSSSHMPPQMFLHTAKSFHTIFHRQLNF
jgi:predicted metal-dependent hydrolase